MLLREPELISSEAVGLLSILQKVEEHYNGHVQLMISIDCLALLMILSKWGQSEFWSDLGDVVHFDSIFPMIKAEVGRGTEG